MAYRQERVSLVFDAETSQAKMQIENLANSINRMMNLSTKSTGINSLDKDLQQASKDAAQLMVQLRNAVNVKTGALDLTKFNDSLKSSHMTLEKYQQSFSSLGPAGEQAFTNLARSIATAEIPLRRSNAVLDDFAKTLKNTVRWQISSSIMHGFLSSMQSAMTYAQNLNKNLTNIRIVTGQSADDMARFAEQANRSAKELSSTTNQYAQAALIFYQQGLGDKEVKERTDTVIKMANVTGEASKDVSSYMTAIWNNFDDGSKSLEYYADVITKLGAATAASSEEIAGGLEKFAAIGNTIGLSYEYATAMLTTIIDKTRQSEDVVGTALKTILARIEGLNLGETLDDGTTLNKYSSALASVGVQIKDTSGEIRTMDAILDDLGAKWKTLGKDIQIALAQTVGGVRQYNQIISLMDNWDAFKANVNIASGAEGSLQEQADIYAESWEAAQKRVRTAAESIYSSLIDENFFIGVDNVLESILGQVKNFIDGLGGIKGVVSTLGTIFLTVFNDQIVSSLKNTTNNIKMMTKSGQEEIIAIKTNAQKLLQDQAQTGTIGGGIAADAYKAEAQAQLVLLNNSKKLSNEEREIASILMKQVQTRVDAQIATAKQLEESENELDFLNARIDSILSSNDTLGSLLGTDDYGLKDKIQSIQDANIALSQSGKAIDDAITALNNATLTDTQKIEALSEIFNPNNFNFTENNTPQSFIDLNEAIDSTAPNIENIRQKISAFIEDISKMGIKTGAIAEGIKNDLKGLILPEETSNDAIDLRTLLALFNKSGEAASKMGDNLAKAGDAIKNTETAVKGFGKSIEGMGKQALTTQDKILIFARSITTFTMMINQIKGLIDTFNNEDLSFGEKALTYLSIISSLIPMIIMLNAKFKELAINEGVAATGAVGVAVAEGTATVATNTFGKAIEKLKTSFGIWGIIATAVTMLIPVIGLLVKTFGKFEEEKTRLEQLNEEIERNNKTLTSLQTNADQVRNAFDKYDSVVNKLNSCTEGTEEWRDALYGVSTAYNELVTNNPIIKEMIKNPEAFGLDSKFLINDKGQINSDYVEKTYLQRMGNVQANALTRSAKLEQEKYEIEINDEVVSTISNILSENKKSSPYYNYINAENSLFQPLGTNTNEEAIGKLFNEYFSYLQNNYLQDNANNFNEFINTNYPQLISQHYRLVAAGYSMSGDSKLSSDMESKNNELYNLIYSGKGESAEANKLRQEITSTFYDIFLQAEGISDIYENLYTVKGKISTNRPYNINSINNRDFSYMAGLYDFSELFGDNTQDILSSSFGNQLLNTVTEQIFKDVDLQQLAENTSKYSDKFLTAIAEAFGIEFSDDEERKKFIKAIRDGITDGEEIKLSDDNIISFEALTAYLEQVYTFGLDSQELIGRINSIISGEYDTETVKNIKKQGRRGRGEKSSEEISKEVADQKAYETETVNKIIMAGGNAEQAFSYNEFESRIKALQEMGLYNIDYNPEVNVPDSLAGFGSEVSGQLKVSTGTALNALSTENKDLYNAVINYANSLNPEEATKLLDKFYGTGEITVGYGGLERLLKIIEELGITGGTTAENLNAVKTEITEGYLEATKYSYVTEEVLSKAKGISEGGNYNAEDLKELETAGFDINKLQTYKAEEEINSFMNGYLQSLQNDLNKVKIGEINVETGKAFTTKEVLSSYNFDYFSLFGTKYFEELDKISGIKTEEYYIALEKAIRNQAEQWNIDITDEWFEIGQENWLPAFKKLASGIHLGEGLSSLASNYTDWIINETGKQLLALKKTGIISSEQLSKLEQIRSTYANMFGITDASKISDETLSQLLELQDFNSYDKGLIEENINSAIESLKGTEGFDENNVNIDEIINYIIQNQIFSLLDSFSETEKIALEAFQSNDYSNINKRQINALKEKVLTLDTDEERKEFAEELGYVDEKGEITEAGRKLGYNYGFELIKELPGYIADGLDEAATDLDIDNLTKYANTFSKSILRNIYSSYGDELTKGQAIGIADLFKGIDNYKQANILGNAIKSAKSAGVDINKIISVFSGINWEEISPDELKASLSELGIDTKYTDEALWNLIQAMQEAAEYTDKLTSALNNYSSLSDIIDKLREGEELSTEEYQQVSNIIGTENAQNAFRMTAEGNYRLEEEINSSGLIIAIKDGIKQSFIEAQQQAQQNADKFQLYNAALDEQSLFIQDSSYTQLYGGPNLSQYVTSNSPNVFGRLNIEEDEEAQGKLITALNQENYSGLTQALNEIGITLPRFIEIIREMANQKLEESIEATNSINTLNMENEVEKQGFSKEQFELVRDAIKDQNEELANNEELLNKVTLQQMRHTRGIETAQKNIEDWAKNLKEGNNALKKGEDAASEYYDTAEEIGEVYADLFDVDAKDFSDGFKRSAENAELLQKALDGDQEALNNLQSLAMQDILAKAKVEFTTDDGTDLTGQSLADRINAIAQNANIEDLKIGAQLDTETFNSLLGDLRFNTMESAQAMNEALGTVGLEGEIVPYAVDAKGKIQELASGELTYTTIGPDGTVQKGYTTPSGSIIMENDTQQVFYGFKNARKTSDPIKIGSSRRSGRGGGGGRGGSGSRAPQAERKGETDKERYHAVTNQLEDLTDNYDKISKAADRAFGKSKVKLIQEQEKALGKLAAKQQDYLDEIKEYYNYDKNNLEQVSQYIGFKVELDENGTITNFDAIQQKMIDEYNSHINSKGEVKGMNDEAWDEYEKEWERIMGLITQYEETQDLWKEAQQQLRDYINELYDLKLEEITYSVEINIDVSDDKLEILDYMIGRIEDDAWEAAEAIATMGEKANELQFQDQTYTKGIRDILMNHTKNIVDSNGNILEKSNLTESDVEGIMSGDADALAKLKTLNNKFTDDEVQALREYNSALIDMNENLVDLREEVYDKVLDSFEAFNDEMDRSIDKIDHLADLTENYKNIVDIVGQKNLEISNALMESVGQAQVDQAINRVEATRSKMLTIQEEVERAQQALDDARSAGLEEDVKLWEANLREMNDALDDAEEDFMQSWEDALTSISERFEEAVERAVDTLSDSLAGPLLGSMEELEELFDRQDTIADRYLPDYEKIYELNKLNRDITNSIDDTDNIKSKQELAKLQEEINELEKDGVQVSEYQVEELRKRYELKLAEAALNEAQNAKSEVRMSRNADGDWSYVYTASDEDVAEAEQNYEDKLFAWQELNANYINDLQDMIVQMEAEMSSKIQDIMNDETLSMEQKMQRVQDTTAFYEEQMGYYLDELDLALGQNQLLYEDDWTKYHEMTGYKISDNENYIDNFMETALATLTGFDTMKDFQQNFNDAIGNPDTGGLLYELNEAYQQWKNNTEEVFEAAGTTMDNYAEKMEDDVSQIVNASNNATDSIIDMGEKIANTFDEITDAVQNWADSYSAIIDNILSKNEALALSFNEVLKQWASFEESNAIDDSQTDFEDNNGESNEGNGPEGTGETIASGGVLTIKNGWMNVRAGPGVKYKKVRASVGDKKGITKYNYSKKEGNWVYVDELGGWINGAYKKYTSTASFDTGGYTGHWGPEGRIAMVHEKEIILNKNDTENFLDAVQMIRDISKVIDLNAYTSTGYGLSPFMANNINTQRDTLEQDVHIEAIFPNATSKDEILSAFKDITNMASQWANRK